MVNTFLVLTGTKLFSEAYFLANKPADNIPRKQSVGLIFFRQNVCFAVCARKTLLFKANCINIPAKEGCVNE